MNMLRRSIFGLLLACGSIAAAALPSAAVESTAHARHLNLDAAFRPLHSKSVPFTGVLSLTIEPNGIINGTYRSTSIRPDPFSNKFNKVTGGVSGDNVNLHIGSTLSFNGKRYEGEWRGTARWRGGFYSFVAKPAHGQPASAM
jgi:hypothetical protein